MLKEELKKLCLESYLKGQEDLLDMLISSMIAYKDKTGQNVLSVDEMILVFNDWLEKVRTQYNE